MLRPNTKNITIATTSNTAMTREFIRILRLTPSLLGDDICTFSVQQSYNEPELGATGGLLTHDRTDTSNALGVALAAVAGLGFGLLVGVVTGELLGEVNSARVKDAVRRLRPGDREATIDPERLAQDLLDVLRNNPTTRGLELEVDVLGSGLVEVSGIAPDDQARELAGALVSGVRGADRVVNRILVPGVDLPAEVGRPKLRAT